MPAMTFVGWLVGLILASLFGAAALLAFGLAVPAFLTLLTAIVAPIATLSAFLTLIASLLGLILAYLIGYIIATRAIAPLLPPLVSGPIIFSMGHILFVPVSGAATSIPPTNGEFFGRGMMIGLTAATDFILLAGLIPVAGILIGSWAFFLISLAIILPVARNRFYQGFLGWSAWLFPVSYIATAIGLLLFLINMPFAFAALGIGAFRIDWTTGVIESTGGIASPASGGYSLGNFNFMRLPQPAGSFTIPSLASHETGHTLNTAAFGGITLWINAVDENLWPGRANLAYPELCAQGHSRNMPGAAEVDFSVRLWN